MDHDTEIARYVELAEDMRCGVDDREFWDPAYSAGVLSLSVQDAAEVDRAVTLVDNTRFGMSAEDADSEADRYVAMVESMADHGWTVV